MFKNSIFTNVVIQDDLVLHAELSHSNHLLMFHQIYSATNFYMLYPLEDIMVHWCILAAGVPGLQRSILRMLSISCPKVGCECFVDISSRRRSHGSENDKVTSHACKILMDVDFAVYIWTCVLSWGNAKSFIPVLPNPFEPLLVSGIFDSCVIVTDSNFSRMLRPVWKV